MTRTFLTPVQRQAANQLIEWMQAAGMQAGLDAIGNVVGRYAGTRPGAPAILIGSHFDTVRDGGKYDGQYGVVGPIACIEALGRSGERFARPIEVIGFADEEGVRYGATLLGSRAVAGTFDSALLERTDADGITMRRAITDYGLDPAQIARAARRPQDVAAYLEIHIEQGPVLLNENRALGIVTAIAGATRFKVTARGVAGHAGTVPMNLRRDAAAAAAEAVLFIERRAGLTPGLVATVGQLQVPGGATNVIPGRAEFTIDVRSGVDSDRGTACADILAEIAAIAARRNVAIEIEKTHDAPAALCAEPLQAAFARALGGAGITPRYLPSGAGHDGMAMQSLTDIAMLFVRCGAGGISHHPDETMSAADAGAGLAVLLNTLRDLANRLD